MKNPIIAFAAFLLVVLSVVACKKTEIQLEDQVLGHWVSSKVYSDSLDVTNFYAFDLTLLNTKKFELIVQTENLLTGKTDTQTANGDWLTDNLEKRIKLFYADNSTDRSYDVKYVDDVRMVVETMQNDKLTEITFEKK